MSRKKKSGGYMPRVVERVDADENEVDILIGKVIFHFTGTWKGKNLTLRLVSKGNPSNVDDPHNNWIDDDAAVAAAYRQAAKILRERRFGVQRTLF